MIYALLSSVIVGFVVASNSYSAIFDVAGVEGIPFARKD